MDVRDAEGGTGLESTSEQRDGGRIHPNVYLHPSGKGCLNKRPCTRNLYSFLPCYSGAQGVCGLWLLKPKRRDLFSKIS